MIQTVSANPLPASPRVHQLSREADGFGCGMWHALQLGKCVHTVYCSFHRESATRVCVTWSGCFDNDSRGLRGWVKSFAHVYNRAHAHRTYASICRLGWGCCRSWPCPPTAQGRGPGLPPMQAGRDTRLITPYFWVKGIPEVWCQCHYSTPTHLHPRLTTSPLPPSRPSPHQPPTPQRPPPWDGH